MLDLETVTRGDDSGSTGSRRSVDAPDGSIIVCTRDRLAFLQRCLASLERQIPQPHTFEVVVVDNGSTDGTHEFLASWAAAEPQRRVAVREPRAGLSRARNLGVGTARAPIVLFLDDDATAPQGWVAAHLRAYRHRPSLDAVGGPIVLSWTDGRPAWVTERLHHWWSALDLGDEARAFPAPHGPYGTNMSMRRERLLDLGEFPAALGRRARSLISGEEAALWTRLWAAGGHIWYEPSSLVVHHVVPDKHTRRWIVRRGVAQGRTNARLLGLGGRRDAKVVLGSCREDAQFALAGLRRLVHMVVDGDIASSDVLDELADCGGHASALVEHVRLALLDVVGVQWRQPASRADHRRANNRVARLVARQVAPAAASPTEVRPLITSFDARARTSARRAATSGAIASGEYRVAMSFWARRPTRSRRSRRS